MDEPLPVLEVQQLTYFNNFGMGMFDEGPNICGCVQIQPQV
jgi:hypothetical protein